MEKKRAVFGLLFLAIFVAHVWILVKEGYPIYLLWFSNHWALILALAAFARSSFWLQAALNIGLVGELFWISDFLSKYFYGEYLFGSTAYIFSATYPEAMYVGGLFHLILLPLALILLFIWGSNEDAWLGSLMYGGFLLVAGALLPKWNLNCVMEPCADILELLPAYYLSFPILMIVVIFISHLVLTSFSEEKE